MSQFATVTTPSAKVKLGTGKLSGRIKITGFYNGNNVSQASEIRLNSAVPNSILAPASTSISFASPIKVSDFEITGPGAGDTCVFYFNY